MPMRGSTTSSRGGSSRGSGGGGGPPPLAPSNRFKVAVAGTAALFRKPPIVPPSTTVPAGGSSTGSGTGATTPTTLFHQDSSVHSSSHGGATGAGSETDGVDNSSSSLRVLIATVGQVDHTTGSDEKKLDDTFFDEKPQIRQQSASLGPPRPPHQTPISSSRPLSYSESYVPNNSQPKTISNHVFPDDGNDNDLASNVSSLTGHGDDEEVEELYQVIADLRLELEQSRNEAARAVKVAEQAIQSAERAASSVALGAAPSIVSSTTNGNATTSVASNDAWQNTVTYQAAAAAAQAQKRSAEAIAAQRVAEQRFEAEKRAAAFWRRQAAIADADAGMLQTRAAAAEVQRQVLAEQLSTILRNQQDSKTDIFSAVALRSLNASSETQRRDNEFHNDQLVVAKEKTRRKKSETSPKRTARSSNTEEILRLLHDEAISVRNELSVLEQSALENLELKLPNEIRQLTQHLCSKLAAAEKENEEQRQRLANERASRKKLLYEVQDLRGVARIYCRIRPMTTIDQTESIISASKNKSSFIVPSQDTVMLNRLNESMNDMVGLDDFSTRPLSFEFDHVFDETASQVDVYNEIEDVCLSVLDGYKICIVCYGPSSAGKTHTLLGNVTYPQGYSIDGDPTVLIQDDGIQLQAMRHLFSIAQNRCDRFKDTFMLTIVEVHDEKLVDSLSGTALAEERGQIVIAESSRSKSRRRSQAPSGVDEDGSSSRLTKLEIRSDLHGDTTVQGALAVEVTSYDEVVQIWRECLERKRHRVADLGADLQQHETSSHVIATLKVTSANITTGHASCGRIHFVDLAGADLVPKTHGTSGNSISASSPTSASNESMLLSSFVSNGYAETDEYRFKHRSLETLNDVVTARALYVRSVPYRNSTLTHLLRDSLEADTKVLLIACVNSDPKHIQSTSATLRFASRMRKVHIGKATKHTIGPP
jgi:kinesin family member C2/C3